MFEFHTPFVTLDYLGVGLFAITGALAAARSRHDVITFVVFAIITGVGGGTLRDLLIGAPVFWVHQAAYLWVCVGAALAVWIVGERLWRTSALVWFDAVGLAAYAVIGSGKALSFGIGSIVAVAMGMLTATFGGILRDVFAGEPSVLLKREIYITAALLAAAVYVGAIALHIDAAIAGGVAFAAGLALRAGAIRFGWTLPGFEARNK
ncbi:MAG TPA: trimeric intracellular cation channel family protein [Rhizomicrobium sp.]|nr:trimeric intracellular cation channel family protein [Rhizomicrobium sp.]